MHRKRLFSFLLSLALFTTPVCAGPRIPISIQSIPKTSAIIQIEPQESPGQISETVSKDFAVLSSPSTISISAFNKEKESISDNTVTKETEKKAKTISSNNQSINLNIPVAATKSEQISNNNVEHNSDSETEIVLNAIPAAVTVQPINAFQIQEEQNIIDTSSNNDISSISVNSNPTLIINGTAVSDDELTEADAIIDEDALAQAVSSDNVEKYADAYLEINNYQQNNENTISNNIGNSISDNQINSNNSAIMQNQNTSDDGSTYTNTEYEYTEDNDNLSNADINNVSGENSPVNQTNNDTDIANTDNSVYYNVNNTDYTEEDLYLLTQVICGEAGSNSCSDEHQLAVGNVVLNRVADPRYGNSIKDVLNQPGQYAFNKNANFHEKLGDAAYARAAAHAKMLLEGTRVLPANCLYQANFAQGHGIYKEYYTNYSITYICY